MIAYESEVNGGESHIALVRGSFARIARHSTVGRRTGGPRVRLGAGFEFGAQ